MLGPPDRKPYVVECPVLEATPGARLAWAAVIPGAEWLPLFLYSGAHEFVLSELADGTTRLTPHEHFNGLLARMVKEGPAGGDEGLPFYPAGYAIWLVNRAKVQGRCASASSRSRSDFRSSIHRERSVLSTGSTLLHGNRVPLVSVCGSATSTWVAGNASTTRCATSGVM